MLCKQLIWFNFEQNWAKYDTFTIVFFISSFLINPDTGLLICEPWNLILQSSCISMPCCGSTSGFSHAITSYWHQQKCRPHTIPEILPQDFYMFDHAMFPYMLFIAIDIYTGTNIFFALAPRKCGCDFLKYNLWTHVMDQSTCGMWSKIFPNIRINGI